MKKIISVTLFLLAAGYAAAQIEVISGGNVGIGTASPGNKLAVEGTGDLVSFGSTTRKFYFAPDTNGVALFTGAGKTGNGFYADVANNAFAVSTNSAERFRVDSSGRFGLGTTSPSFPFSFGTALGNKIALYDAGSGAGYGFGVQNSLLQVFANTSADRVGIGYGNSGSFTETLSVKADKVGIGTTSPVNTLDIVGPSNNYQGMLRLRALNTNNAALTLWTGGASTMRNWQISSNYATAGGLSIMRSTSNTGDPTTLVMEMDVSGNVGIGTASPSQKLEVAGSVRATSFISNSTTYADFVFEPGYKLPALSEVEAHIKEHGHLPDIPSEAEAMANGIDLAAMQVKLLQKIEELTLHQIAQEKEIAALKRELQRK